MIGLLLALVFGWLVPPLHQLIPEPPPPPPCQPCAFLFYSDAHGDSPAFQRVVRAMALELSGDQTGPMHRPIDFVVSGGDNVDEGHPWEEHQRAIQPLRSVPWYTAQGNHDWDDLDWVLDHAPHSWPIHIECGCVDVFALPWGIGGYSLSWLRDRLQESRARYRVLVLHHPLYICSTQGRREVKAELLREFLLPIIRDQVELVLTGHDHVYCEQRAYGIDFVTASCAGSKFYRCKQRLEDEGECIERMNCFVLVEAGEDFNWRPVFVPKEDEEDG